MNRLVNHSYFSSVLPTKVNEHIHNDFSNNV